ncbi:MAG: aminoglycoside phosphotransferase family protein [Deltaproteobacteria bacterium]|nr:aminoglycoside phosphotransferase family protein [Deltaproteobacteria bacterium]
MGLWTDAEVLLAMETAVEVAAEEGLDAAGATLIRSAGSVLVDLPLAGVIARVERPEAIEHARRQVDVASLCERQRAPVVRIVGPRGQPVLRPGGAVMFLERLIPTGERLPPAAHGAALRQLHERTAGLSPGAGPTFDPFRLLFHWLDEASLPELAADLAEVRRRAVGLAAQWSDFASSDPLGEVLVHGDPHTDNVILTTSGPVFVDLESSGVGPASWDLAVLATGVRRYGTPEHEWSALVDAYGVDPSGSPSFDALCAVYELDVIAWAAASGDRSPHLAAEARLRLDSLLGRSEYTWALL